MTSQFFRVPILQMRILRLCELLSLSPSHTRLLCIKVKAVVTGTASDSVVEEHGPPVLGRAGPGLGRQAVEGSGERNPLGLQTGVTAVGKYCRGSAQGAAVRAQPWRSLVLTWIHKHGGGVWLWGLALSEAFLSPDSSLPQLMVGSSLQASEPQRGWHLSLLCLLIPGSARCGWSCL